MRAARCSDRPSARKPAAFYAAGATSCTTAPSRSVSISWFASIKLTAPLTMKYMSSPRSDRDRKIYRADDSPDTFKRLRDELLHRLPQESLQIPFAELRPTAGLSRGLRDAASTGVTAPHYTARSDTPPPLHGAPPPPRLGRVPSDTQREAWDDPTRGESPPRTRK